MAYAIATLDSSDLPPQFTYSWYIVSKRNTTTPTVGAVVIQEQATTQLVHGGDFINWSCEGITPAEMQFFHTKYYTTSQTAYTFTGYWGEELTVYFSQLDPPKIRGRVFDVSGTFQVISVSTGYTGVTCETGR